MLTLHALQDADDKLVYPDHFHCCSIIEQDRLFSVTLRPVFIENGVGGAGKHDVGLMGSGYKQKYVVVGSLWKYGVDTILKKWGCLRL